ncbi:MAG: hypothetical protein O3B64_03210 [bacterium]|nr:hypothetical protein [bacterium]
MNDTTIDQSIETLRSAFVELWADITLFLPQLVMAFVVLLLGILIGMILQAAIVRIITALKVNELLEKIEVIHFFEKVSIKLDVAHFFGWLIKWFIIIFALIGAADILQWEQVTIFLNDVVSYIPNVVISVVILLVGMVLANFVHDVIQGAMDATKVRSVGFISGLAKWAVIVFSFMAALVQLGIAESLIQVLFTGFIAMVALAGGLSFGLGGREHAKQALEMLKKDLGGK